jgi:hypothetical protein
VSFVIRLKTGVNLLDGAGKVVELSVPQGKTRLINRVFYKGSVQL